MKLSIIVPAYNEEDRIVECINAVRRNVERAGVDYELIVVDDGSTDRTRERASSMADNPHVKLTSYKPNLGKGYALMHGFRFCTGDIIAFIDGDAEVSPDRLFSYFKLAQIGDIIIASKRHPDSRVDSPFLRKFLSLGFQFVVRITTGLPVRDSQSGMKVFKRDVLERVLPRLSSKRFAFDLELLTVAHRYGYRIVEMPITISIRKTGDLLRTWKMLYSMLYEIMGIMYRLRIRRSYV